ncbi:MAG: HAMP domain-containing protein [Thermoflexales bacterium]|nr:HAMP domain-containing protein [Thermoflexales bacterium]
MPASRSSLRYRIGVSMLLLSLGPLLIFGGIVLWTILGQLDTFSARLAETKDSLSTEVVGRSLKGAASDTAAEIDDYMLSRIIDVRHWSEDRDVIEAARLGRLAVREQGLRAESVQGQFVPISPTVYSLASSFLFLQVERPKTPFVEILVTEASGLNVLLTRPVSQISHAGEAWWQAAGLRGVAGVGLTDVYLDASTGSPVMGIALPVIDPNTKEVLGVLRALIKLENLQSRISQKASSVDAAIHVFTAGGDVIADTASAHSAQVILAEASNLTRQDYAPAVRALAAQPGMEGAGFMALDGAGGRDLVGYAHTSGSRFYDRPAQLSGFEGLGWGVTAARPEARALQVLLTLIQTESAFRSLPTLFVSLVGLVIALAAVVTVLVTIVVSGSITGPLVNLSQVAQRVRAGDLAAHVDVQSADEVGMLASTFNTMIAGLRERERERDMFGRVVSPEVREKLLQGQLELGGETRQVTVLFSDIRGFSTMSERMSAHQVVTFLNEYLTEMSEAIRPWGGYLNNFIGDAIVVIFGAPLDQPDKEYRAVAAAMSMRERLDALNRRRAERGEPPIESGIGISTGEAVAGQVGSLERLMYTVIGDAVNVAARLETLTKDYPQHPILLNGLTAETLRAHADIALKSLGPIQVKGRARPVDVYAVVERRTTRSA